MEHRKQYTTVLLGNVGVWDAVGIGVGLGLVFCLCACLPFAYHWSSLHALWVAALPAALGIALVFWLRRLGIGLMVAGTVAMTGVAILYVISGEMKVICTRGHYRIASLGDGAEAFKMDHGHYPGERAIGHLVGNGGKFTGSQILAARMFGYPLDRIGQNAQPRSEYSPYSETSLLTLPDGSFPGTLADGNPKPMAICYYIARPGKTGAERFVEADNIPYTHAAKGGDFLEYVRSMADKWNGSEDTRFLLLAPGPDRKYFTDDDVTRW